MNKKDIKKESHSLLPSAHAQEGAVPVVMICVEGTDSNGGIRVKMKGVALLTEWSSIILEGTGKLGEQFRFDSFKALDEDEGCNFGETSPQDFFDGDPPTVEVTGQPDGTVNFNFAGSDLNLPQGACGIVEFTDICPQP